LTASSDSDNGASAVYAAAFEALPDVTLLLGPALEISAANLRARRELGPLADLAGVRCCRVLQCQAPCPADLAVERQLPVHGQSAGVPPRQITAVPLGDGSGVLLQIRVTSEPGLTGGAELTHIRLLGNLTVERAGRDLGGVWLGQRPGLVFKYLLSARGRTVTAEELLDALWPNAGRSAVGNVRQTIHVLRRQLEQDEGTQVIAGRRGGYSVDLRACVIDADEFETRATAALRIGRDGARELAPALHHAAGLYTGDYLADTPYGDWALAERDRLRSLAARVLWELATLEMDAGRLEAATGCLYRLTELEPLELQAQRALLSVLIDRGHHAEAARRYDAVRLRFKRAFERELDFRLADLA